jgi:hypothetical protein
MKRYAHILLAWRSTWPDRSRVGFSHACIRAGEGEGSSYHLAYPIDQGVLLVGLKGISTRSPCRSRRFSTFDATYKGLARDTSNSRAIFEMFGFFWLIAAMKALTMRPSLKLEV